MTFLIIITALALLTSRQINAEKLEECSSEEGSLFGWEDYLVVLAMLVGSCCIGLFFCLFDKKQTTSADFLLGGGSMGTFPMAMSLGSGFVTAIELLGNPAEMYGYGTQFWMTCFAFLLIVPITSYFYLPVFFNLRLTSCYEYLQLRFDSKARTIGSALYIFQMMLYTSVAVYAPALALSNVTGLNVYLAVTVVYVVCVFYASQGGMKAVIITDSFQASVLIGSVICILVLGNNMEGGWQNVLDLSLHSQRLEFFNMDPNPTIRHSFWTVVVGGTFYWGTMFCSNQASIQKYLSVKELSQARKALWASAGGLILVYSINFFTGMIMYAAFRGCDPQRSGQISGSDELLPFFVMEFLGKFKGVPGFFVAGIFSASLGTVAAALNSLSAVTLQDFIGGALGVKIPDEKGATYAKWLSLFYGVISFLLIFLVEQLGSVLEIALSFNGMIGGITLGLFTLGMFIPWANARGATFGSIISLIFVMWIGIGAQLSDLQFEQKTTSIEDCSCLNLTAIIPSPNEQTEVLSIYKLSYLWYSAVGCLLTVIIGSFLSWISKPQDPLLLDLNLLTPVIAKRLKQYKKENESLNFGLTQRNQISTVIPSNFSKGITNLALDLGGDKPPTIIAIS